MLHYNNMIQKADILSIYSPVTIKIVFLYEVKMIQTTIMKGDSEVVRYDCPGIPLYIRTAQLSSYPERRALCHWHDDLEWIHILEGSMNYYINGHRITLKTGDSLMVTPRQIHYGYAVRRQEDCRFICILLHPDLITQNRLLFQKYLQPLLENCPADHLHFPADTPGGSDTGQVLKTAAVIHRTQAPGWELDVIGMLISLFARSLPLLTPEEQCSAEENGELTAQRKMVSYIYHHYPEKLSLDDIAAAGNVCRSKCCAIFRRYMQQTPVSFLNAYRLQISSDLLRRSSDSITEIALSCGFRHMSYFSELFCKTYECTPRQYRTNPENTAEPPKRQSHSNGSR